MSSTRTCLEQFATSGERKAATRLVARALELGYSVTVYDGEEYTLRCSRDRRAILAALATTDRDTLSFWEGRDPLGHALLIWGNDPDGSELVADHTDRPELREIVGELQG